MHMICAYDFVIKSIVIKVMKEIWLYRECHSYHYNMLMKVNLHNVNSCMDDFTLYILLTGSFTLQFLITYVFKRVSGISVIEFAVFVKL